MGLICVSCNSKSNRDERKVYDETSDEFFVYNVPISSGTGAFMNKLLNDGCWAISVLVDEDDWWENPFLDYSTVHWCKFQLSDTIPVRRYVEINRLLFGDLPVFDTLSKHFDGCDTCTSSNWLGWASNTEIQISWYQSGQIEKICIENHGLSNFSDLNGYGNVTRQKEMIFDSIFPDKKIANRSFGYFNFFGIKNASVYVTDGYDEYQFEEVTNEKYKISLYDVLPKFKRQ